MKGDVKKFLHYAREAIYHEDKRVSLKPFGEDGEKVAAADPMRAGSLESTGINRLDNIVAAAGLHTEIGGAQPVYWHTENGDGEVDSEGLRFPRAERFRSPELQRSVLLHELSHWAAQKVGQPLTGLGDIESAMFHMFGIAPESYNIEEMTAELAAALVQSELEPIPDDLAMGIGSYIGSYLNQIPEDRRAAVEEQATRDAQVRADYLLSLA